ncbi:MAG: hypothetical protein Q8O90_12780, partial [Elusimicrobiota bacterium]|nr:hypothetical protein [Elusimicrobiota bacterium]
AMTGPKPCSVQLSWVADTDLPQGTTFYVHYATYSGVAFDATVAQYSFFTAYPEFNGSFISRLVPGLEAGNGAPAAGGSNIDSPRYYFRLGYQKPADVAVTAVNGSTDAVASTPGTWDRLDRYPNGNLFVVNNVHGEKFPLVRDAAGNIYTAGSFNAWGWNSNTAYVRKFSAAGLPLWTRYYSDQYENSNPVINALALDAAGNLYAAGTHGSDASVYNTFNYTYGPESAARKDILLIKYNSSGRMLWRRSFDAGGGFNESASALAIGADGAVLVGGSTQDSGTFTQALALKYNSEGVRVSTRAFTGMANSFITGFAFDSVNSILLAVGGSNWTDTLLMR